jgi:V8-like Glu-specific endopeptidase
MVKYRLKADLAESTLYGRLIEERSYAWPYNIHGMVHINFNNHTSFYRSGTLINSKLVLTAASSILSELKEIPSSIYFLQPSKANYEIISTRVIDFYYPEEFNSTGKEDYAVLVLENDAPSGNQYFELKSFERKDLLRSEARIYGFPLSIKGHFLRNSSLWGAQVKLAIDDSDEKLIYRIDPSIGMNGSAIYIQKDSKLYAIGIQIEDGTAIYLNSLRILRIRQLIREYCSKYMATSEHNLYSLSLVKCDPSLELSHGIALDTSSKLLQTEESPFIVQGIIQINLEDGTSYNTKGSAIGPRSIITSSHEFIGTQGLKIQSIYFIPLYKDQTAHSIEVVEVHIADNRPIETCALLRLESDISGYKGQLKVKNFRGAIVYRYPIFVYIHSLNICLSTHSSSLEYILEVFAAEADSSIYLQMGDTFYLLAVKIQTYSSFTHKAIHLNSTKISQVKDWMYRTYLDSPRGSFYFKDSAYFKREGISDLDLPKLQALRYSQLTILDLSHSSIGPQVAKYLADEILNNLTALNLAFNNLGLEGAKYISLKGSQNLIKINLAFNNLLYEGAVYIVQGNFRRLKHLNLDGNSIIDRGLLNLCKFRIRSLSLMCNRLGDILAYSIAQNCPKLIYLNLSCNEIGSSGAIDIHRKCSCLEYLNLENNRIGHRAGAQLASGHDSITHLYLGGNKLGNGGSWPFRNNNIKRLQVLDLSDNEVCLIGYNRLREVYGWRIII